MLHYVAAILCVVKFLCIFFAGCAVIPFMGFSGPSQNFFSYLSAKVFLPCLILANLPTNLSISLLASGYYWCFVFFFVHLLLSILISWFTCYFVKRNDLRPLVFLCTLFPNVIGFSLSIVLSLEGLSWFGPDQKAKAKVCTFIFNTLASIGLWGCGEFFVKKAAKKFGTDIEIDINGERLEASRCGDSTNTGISRTENGFFFLRSISLNSADNLNNGNFKGVRSKNDVPKSTNLHQNQDRTVSSQPIRIKRWWLELNNNKAFLKIKNSTLLQLLCSISHNVTVIMSLFGIVFGIFPPTHYVFRYTKIGEFIVGTFLLLAPGTVPLFILLLGMNLSCSARVLAARKLKEETAAALPVETEMCADRGGSALNSVQSKDAKREITEKTNLSGINENRKEQIGDEKQKVNIPIVNQLSYADTTTSTAQGGKNKISTKSAERVTEFFCHLGSKIPRLERPIMFTVIITLNRLVFIPVLFLAIMIFLYKVLPKGTIPETPGFRMSMCVISSSPGATGSTILCTLSSYRSIIVSQTLLFEYITAIFTTTAWLLIYIHIFGNNIDIKH